jgi:LmbE family N-acetylglucosaminyl deacetylase
MRKASSLTPGAGLSALLIGAHADDIEIGCGGSLLRWIEDGTIDRIHWLVLSGAGTDREAEARASAAACLADAAPGAARVEVEAFRDAYFPYDAAIKDHFERLKDRVAPDLILTHRQADLHQDHRVTSELTWNTFRDHLIFEYEVPKYDGDLGTPNVYVELPDRVVDAKVRMIVDTFGSQSCRDWFSEETFRAMLRLRGIECRSESGFAEGLYARKLKL